MRAAKLNKKPARVYQKHGGASKTMGLSMTEGEHALLKEYCAIKSISMSKYILEQLNFSMISRVVSETKREENSE